MPNPKPWSIHFALFARRSFTPPAITTAKEESIARVAFEQMVSDLETTTPRAIPILPKWGNWVNSGGTCNLVYCVYCDNASRVELVRLDLPDNGMKGPWLPTPARKKLQEAQERLYTRFRSKLHPKTRQKGS